MRLFNQPRNILAFTSENFTKLLDLLTEHQRTIENNPYSEYEDIDVTFGSADTDKRIDLIKLNRTPTSYTIVKKDRACDIYTGVTAWAKNVMFLKSSVSDAVVKVRVT